MSTRSFPLSDIAVSDTRAHFLAAAKRLFAERGFAGASLAVIAEELGLTKQALIHHFGTKERLYAEVLSSMAGQLTGAVAHAEGGDPEARLEALFVGLYRNGKAHPDETRLILREMLDNRARAETAQAWPLRAFIDAIVALAGKTPVGAALEQGQILARAYLLLGAFNFAIISDATLRRMYGEAEWPALEARFEAEIRSLVRAAFS